MQWLLKTSGRNIASQPEVIRNDSLPNEPLLEIETFERLLCKAFSVPRNEDRGIEFASPPSIDPEIQFQNILARLWNTVVKPILDGLAFSVRSLDSTSSTLY